MEMVLNNGFCEMSQDEIMLLEGGGVWRHIGYAGATVCCIMACVATGGWAAAAAGAAAGWYWYDATR
ncbi:hypothetical protein G4313_11655 [Coprococcus eutactus]|jgi:hypothetical protein|uniref:Class IIb bacteriocin, lactobin A/cerein 7B family n=1 Tax=Coprococcus ammoniilyticus TaxID=2981785 RepID=A0ABV1EM27_9FIRM|nr:hypothetical protein [Coprococcus ammoniilyticus]MCU6731560.1 hypothetical protein [Coprococcus ammoniilyticus]NSE53677.1 hypothetical protein [Coprococcus eutactus]CCY61230.1 unknown [Clostridium sp. CAG:264]SCI22671.1 Uncharacterised protein [uncultured Coprococcus sp.]